MEAALDEMEIASELPADRHWSPLALGGLIPVLSGLPPRPASAITAFVTARRVTRIHAPRR